MATLMAKPSAAVQANDLQSEVAAAQAELARAVQLAGLDNDPLGHAYRAQSTVIGLFPELVARMDATRQPLSESDMQQLQRSLASGVAGQVGRAVRTMDKRNLIYAALAVAAIAVVGGCVGAWLEYYNAEAKVAAAEERVADVYNRTVQVNDGLGTKITMGNAERWLWLMHINVGNDLRECVPAKAQVPQGQRCSPTLWTQLPLATASK